MCVLRRVPLLALALLPTLANADDWRTTDWSHRIVDEGKPSEYRVATTESYEFYQGGKSKAALLMLSPTDLLFAFWPYRLEAGAECDYQDFAMSIDDDFPLAIEVGRHDSGGYTIKLLGVKFPQFDEIVEWDAKQLKFAFYVSQRIHLSVVQDCQRFPEQPENLNLTFSTRGGKAAVEFLEGGRP